MKWRVVKIELMKIAVCLPQFPGLARVHLALCDPLLPADVLEWVSTSLLIFGRYRL